MKFSHLTGSEKRKKADLLVLPFWKDKHGARSAMPLDQELLCLTAPALESGDFKGKEGETLFLYVLGLPEKRIALLGLGLEGKATTESLRRSFGSVTKSSLSKRVKSINVFVPLDKKLDEEDLLRGMIEGLLLPNYLYHGHKHREPDEPVETLIEEVTWIGPYKRALAESKKISTICKGIYFARDLINGSADEITPQYLAECAKGIAKKNRSIKATIFDKKKIQKEKLNLLLAVNRGSSVEPSFIILEYRGNPHSKDHTVLVGKGVTYDTGGLNLKSVGMDTMKSDMAGAAACLGVILGASRLGMKVNLTIVIPSTENCIDANSFKPGDVYQSYLGKSVEMTNSDGEGRLILADGLAYAIKNLQPTRLIDIATLTGAIEIALGAEASGLMSTNDELADSLIRSGEVTFERLWRMPLFDEYKERLKSDVADLKSWNGRAGGASVAATFIRQFVDESIPWAHLDIAGTAYASEAKKYLPKYATGFGIRLLLDFLETLEKQNS